MTKISRFFTRFLSNTALVVGSILVCLLLFEVVVRLAFDYEEVFLVADTALGFTHPPGRSGLYMRERTEPHLVSINSKGLRDREFDYEKPPDVRRIVMLGDSMTEGMQVALNETASKQLEHLLHEKGYSNYEVLNFGVSAYGTTQQLLYYTREAVKYDPDIIVVNLFFGNDLIENVYREGNFQRPAYTLEDGELVFHPSQTQGNLKVFLRDKVLTRSAVLKLIKPALVSGNPALHKLLGRLGLVAGIQDIDDFDLMELVEVTNKILQKLQVETQSRGHELLVNVIPSSVDLYPSYPDDMDGYPQLVRDRWDELAEEEIARHAFYHRHIGQFLSTAGIPFADSYSRLHEGAALEEPLHTSMLIPSLQRGHLSPLGHRRSAESILEALETHDLL
jgi:lysophospholipase L1-like esterase